MSLAQYSKTDLKEMSMIEIAYALLEEKTDRQAMSFQEIIAEIKAAAEMSDQELKTRLAQFYTDINIDGRFLTVGDNHWGLRGWYPFDQAEEEVIPVAKPKKKKAVVEEVEDFDDLEEDLDYEDVDDLDEEEDFEDIDELEEDEDDLAEDDFDDLEDDLDDDEEDEEEDYEDEKEK
ncbi:DNA-directed RNA polymerase subunit delta [Priestia megaterium]|uniref:DNA-directed RNA polymerase subunit delta n=1 Tax=Priestia megaterium TaxID=1404 RepID=UPI002FFF2033